MGEAAGRASVDVSHLARLAVRVLDVDLAAVVAVGHGAAAAEDGAGPPLLGRAGSSPGALAQVRRVAAEVARSGEPVRDADASGSCAGWPVVDRHGRVHAVLGVLGRPGRRWDDADTTALADLARAVGTELRLGLADAVLAATDVGLAAYDAEGRPVLVNPRARRLAAAAGVDLDVAPHVGTQVRHADRVTPVDARRQPVARALARLAGPPGGEQSGAGPSDGEPGADDVQWVGPLGDQRAVLATTSDPVAPGVGPLVLVGWHDVTPLALELEVEERFAATVSHELRTPLTAILGYLELLVSQIGAGDPGDPAAAAQVALAARVERAALTLQARVADLLDGAARRRSLDLRRTDLGELVRRVVDAFAPAADAAGLTLAAHTGDTGDRDAVLARVDGPRLEQALENLVANSLKYTAAGGRVDVRLRPDGHRVLLEVADTGVGMTPAEVELAFEQYWRSADARAGTREGAGLGLPLVQQIATEHRGHVRLRSTPGRGTVATLTLPREPEQEHTASGSSPTSPRNTAATREV